MPDESPSKPPVAALRGVPRDVLSGGVFGSDRSGLREPVYLASQLASICDVDLKTIHNWCALGDSPDLPPELECFRTPGGHLRFRHTAVLRFLTRWGYPIPDDLLRDRPHVLLVEPDAAARRQWINVLGLVRPGEEEASPTEDPMERVVHAQTPQNDSTPPGEIADATHEAPVDATLGLWAAGRYYVHLWNDPYLALVAVGERTGAGAPPDLAVLSVPTVGLDPTVWISAGSHTDGHEIRFVLVTADPRSVPAVGERGVVGVVAPDDDDGLRSTLDEQATALMPHVIERSAQRSTPGTRKRRIPMSPREPIFVASQVANIWDVDLKTVHNWVERGDIEAFRTPGRHLRFRRRSLLHFLRRYNMAIPDDLVPGRPRVLVVDPGSRYLAYLMPSLDEMFEVIVQPDPVAALVQIGRLCAGAGMIDAVVVALPAEGIDDRAWLSALEQHPDTRYTRLVVISGDDERQRVWQELGVLATVARTGLDQVAPVLERALGVVRREMS